MARGRGICNACGGVAEGILGEAGYDAEQARCEKIGQYIWTCKSCNYTMHLPESFPTSTAYYCPRCNSSDIRNFGINFN